MMYMIAYTWNIMWLDVVVLLPVVVLCMERMLRSGKWLAYTLTLALALFANYYIGFMLCIFLVLYMAVWLFRQPRTGLQMGVACGRFALGSLLGGGLSAALLVPTALALGRTSAAGDGLPAFDSNFPLFDLFGQFFYGVDPTVRSGNLPNLYCGVVAVVILPLYFCQKAIPLRRRLTYGGLLGVLLLSCTITQWDLLWHGLHAPNDLPYRFSFLACFVVLLLTARVLTNLRQVEPKHIFYSMAASAVYLVLWERFGGEDSAPEPMVLYANLLLLALYGGVLLLGAARRLPARMPRQAVTWLLLAVVVGEMMLGGTRSITVLHEAEHYTARDSYVDNDETAADAVAIQHAQQLALKEGQKFCRVERLPHFSCMDTALHHYKGITTFASSNPFLTAQFMGRLGYAFNGVNSYLYNSFVPAADSLFGIRYVVLRNRITSHAQLELVDGIKVGEEERYIYRNRMALPVAFMAGEEVLNFASISNDPFYNQERLWQALTDEAEDVYTSLVPSPDTDGATINGSGFYKPDTTGTAKYVATVAQAGQYFAFAECRAADSITVETFKNGELKNSWSVTTHEPYVIDMGTLQPDQTVEVTIGADGGVSGNIYLMRLEKDILQQYV
ncbi:MAG: YfhO family protein, partial [Clostridia bacterium]|nr:YfhO family protein [Clostridia bacterium]